MLLVACDGSTAAPPGNNPGHADAASPTDSGSRGDAGALNADSGITVDAGLPADSGSTASAWAAVQAIMLVKCSPCHAAGNTDRRVVVSNHGALVGVTSVQSAPMPYVTGGDLDQSFLYLKIANTFAAPCRALGHSSRQCGGRMPPPRERQLTATETMTIRDWIAGGAPN